MHILIFSYQNKLEVLISPTVEKFLRNIKTSYDYRVENGGILIGTVDSKSLVTITNITEAQPKDRCLKFHFFRSPNGHQSIMDELWIESNYRKMYLGEWHTHSEPIPIPSKVDIAGWKSIAKRKQNSTWMLFIILGKQSFRLWTVDNGNIKELTLNAQ